MALIGLSLSFCIRDIQSGCIDENDVYAIISGTKAPTHADFNELCYIYEGIYWKEAPIECSNIAKRMFYNGQIVQPRVNGQDPPNLSGGIWIETKYENRRHTCDIME